MNISPYIGKHVVGFQCVQDFTDFLQWLETNTHITWLSGKKPSQAVDVIRCVKHNLKNNIDAPYILLQEDMLYGSMQLLDLHPRTENRVHFSELLNQCSDGMQSRIAI